MIYLNTVVATCQVGLQVDIRVEVHSVRTIYQMTKYNILFYYVSFSCYVIC